MKSVQNMLWSYNGILFRERQTIAHAHDWCVDTLRQAWWKRMAERFLEIYAAFWSSPASVFSLNTRGSSHVWRLQADQGEKYWQCLTWMWQLDDWWIINLWICSNCSWFERCVYRMMVPRGLCFYQEKHGHVWSYFSDTNLTAVLLKCFNMLIVV